jgi:hypothetical protein
VELGYRFAASLRRLTHPKKPDDAGDNHEQKRNHGQPPDFALRKSTRRDPEQFSSILRRSRVQIPAGAPRDMMNFFDELRRKVPVGK